jgi:hypothetical protein
MRNEHAHLPENDPVHDGPADEDYSTCRVCGVRLPLGERLCGGGKCINMARETGDYRIDDEEPF